MLLFWMVILLFDASALLPRVVPLPDKIPATAITPELPEMLQFFTVSLFAPLVASALAIQITVALALPLVIVRLRSVPPPPIDPSMVTPSAPLSLIKPPPVDVPDIVRGTPPF